MGRKVRIMPKYEITIITRYLVELDDLHSVRERITEEYENATLPAFIPEKNVEYLDGSIIYDLSTLEIDDSITYKERKND